MGWLGSRADSDPARSGRRGLTGPGDALRRRRSLGVRRPPDRACRSPAAGARPRRPPGAAPQRARARSARPLEATASGSAAARASPARPVSPSAAHTTAAATTCPHWVRHPHRARRAGTPGCAARTRSTAAGATFSPPVTITSSARPSTSSRPSRHRPRSPVRNRPPANASPPRRRAAIGAQVAGGQRGATEQDPPVLVELDRDAVEWHAVVHAPARGLAHAVGRDHSHPGGQRAFPGRRVERRTPDEHGCVAAQRRHRPLRVQDPAQLVGTRLV